MEDNNEQLSSQSEATATESKSKPNFLSVIGQNKNLLLLILGSAAAFLIVFLLVFFIFFYQSSLDEYAEQFCNCAETSQSEFYNYSKDGFGYRSDMTGCFAEDFKNYSEKFNKMEKQRLIKDFHKKVVEKCPNKLSQIFEYK